MNILRYPVFATTSEQTTSDSTLDSFVVTQLKFKILRKLQNPIQISNKLMENEVSSSF